MKQRSGLALVTLAIAVSMATGRISAQENLWNGVVHEDTTGLQVIPSVAFLGSRGDFVVCWNNVQGQEISFRRFDHLGNPIDALEMGIPNSETKGDEEGPGLASMANGDFIVTWVDKNDAERVYGQYIRSDGQFEGSRRQLNLPHLQPFDCPPGLLDIETSRLALYSDPVNTGSVKGALSFVEDRRLCESGDHDTVFMRFFQIDYTDADPFLGLINGGQFRVDDQGVHQDSLDLQIMVATSPDGTFLVTWNHLPGGPLAMYSTYEYDPNPEVITNDTAVDDTLLSSQDPFVSSFNDNGYVIAWSALDTQGTRRLFCRFFDSSDDTVGDLVQISQSGAVRSWGDVSAFQATNDFFASWSGTSGDVYGRILDHEGKPIPSLGQAYRDQFLISGTADAEIPPRVATFKDRFVVVWEAEGDIYASLNTLDSHAPTIDTTLTYPAGAVLYDTLGTRSIPVATVVVDSGARIDAGLDQVTLTWEYHCPRGDSSYGSGPMNGTTDPDSFYFYLSNIDSPGTEIRYYITATDSALNQNQYPGVPGDVNRVFVANLGDVNVNSLIDPYDVAVLEDHVCLDGFLEPYERVFADFNEDDTLTCVDVDSLRARAVEAFDPDTLASCGELPVDNQERVFIEIGVGGAIQGGSDVIPVYLDNDSVSVKGIHLGVRYDGSFLAVADTSTTTRSGSLDMSPPCCPPPQAVPAGVESYNLVGLGADSLPPGSGSILDLEVSVSGSTPDGAYHFTLTKDVLYGPDHEPVYTIPLRGKFFVPAPPPVSIVCTPIADTLLAPGDTLTFNTTLTNHSDSTSSPQFFVYGTTTGPDSFTFLAVDTTQILQLAPGGRKRDVTDLEVPAQAPAGHYVFTAHVVNPVKDTTLDTDSFGFGVSGPSKPGFGGGELARAGEGMRPWRVIRGWFGYLDREGRSEQDDITSPGLPRAFSLSQNYPNPFNPSTTIRYEVPVGQTNPRVSITVFDLRGRRIRQLLDEERTPGGYSAHWDGRDARGREVPSGVYLYRIDAGDFVSTRKMILLR